MPLLAPFIPADIENLPKKSNRGKNYEFCLDKINMSYEIIIENKKINFEIENLAKRTNGETMIRCGDTQALATVVMAKQEAEDLGFFPLTTNYEERYYAAGKILGSRYIRREGRPSDNATIISRVIDRTIRPLFPENLNREIQVIITCLSWDEENDPDVLGILAASLALSCSDIPWQGPIGAVRIGLKNKEFIINPTYDQREQADLDIIFAGVKRNGKILINMVEGNGEQVEEELVITALKKALPEIEKLIDFQEKIQQKIGKEKIPIKKLLEPALEKEINGFLDEKIENILFSSKTKDSEEQGFQKAEKLNELKQDLTAFFEEKYPKKISFIKNFFEKQIKKIVQKKALQEQKRVDGRKLDEIRELYSEVGLIPRTHGSGLFSRGVTKSLSILTLGGPEESQVVEGMEIMATKRFLHHYNFPPYCSGEVKRLASPSRREIGHGMLAEKALLPLIPKFEDFPYTIRIVSEILCSNGSTSMASVCSSSLALMDAGVPIERPVAGIAMGLMTNESYEQSPEKDNNYKLLTDIQGPEDFNGDMDFKIAGTNKGITALQMDTKISGISEKIFEETIKQGKQARLLILKSMAQAIERPRTELSPFAPTILKIQIPQEKIGEVIGPKGQTIKAICQQTETEITIEPTGLIFITGSNKEMAKKALSIIKNMTRVIKVGESFLGTVKRVLNFGVFLELEPGQEGMLPALAIKSKVNVGDKIPVQVESIDELGRINLGLKGQTTKQYGSRTTRRKKF